MPVAASRVARLNRIAAAQQLQQRSPDPLQDAVWRGDCWAWVCAQVQTVDEASQAIRPWPQKPYLREVFQLLQTERLLAFPKSRRMLISWAIAVYCTWKARYHPYELMLVQSATEEKAAYLVGNRCRFIEEHLVDPRYRKGYDKWRTKKGLVGKMEYWETHSQILSVAQGGDVVRSYTFSFLCMDESEFQQEAHAALVAALPAVEKGAQIVLVSTSNGPQGELARLCKTVGFARWSSGSVSGVDIGARADSGVCGTRAHGVPWRGRE